MVKNNCNTNQKTRFSRVKKLPSKLIPGTVYIVESDTPGFADLYTVNNNGELITLVDSDRFLQEQEEPLSLIDYRSDIDNLGTDYFYGYEYEDNSFKIIKVEKGNVVNQMSAINMTGTFDTNWTNRTTLTYN